MLPEKTKTGEEAPGPTSKEPEATNLPQAPKGPLEGQTRTFAPSGISAPPSLEKATQEKATQEKAALGSAKQNEVAAKNLVPTVPSGNPVRTGNKDRPEAKIHTAGMLGPAVNTPEMQEIHKKIEDILKDYNFLESEIPLSSEYWGLLGRYRSLKHV